jgi:GT2 family glycosyltransferase
MTAPAVGKRVIVIDNGSKTDPGPQITRRFPDIECMRLDKNIGFAAGCNLGAERLLAHGVEFILFLNNDTIAEPDLLTLLTQSFIVQPALGVVSPLIRRSDPVPEIEFAGGIIRYAFGQFRTRRLPPGNDRAVQLCDYASGCCMLVSRQAFETIGPLDETFFAYFEDTDFSIRAWKNGLKVACRTDAVITHKGSATTRDHLTLGTVSALKHYLVARNRLLVLRKHAPVGSRIFFVAIVQPLIVVYYLFGFLSRLRLAKAHAFLSGVRDGLLSSPRVPQIDRWLSVC